MAGSLLDRAKGLLGLGGRSTADQKPGASAASVTAKKPANPYHAVSIVPGTRCCAEAQALEGRRFLSKDAPSLPLKKCDRPTCTCRYQHHEDRRVGPRRAREMGVAVDGWSEAERRAPGRGRRKTDKPE